MLKIRPYMRKLGLMIAIAGLLATSAPHTAAAPGEQGQGCINTDLVALPGTQTSLINSRPAWDYGDAPDATKVFMTTFYTAPGAPVGKFPTIAPTANSAFGTPGARHQIVNVGWLGNDSVYGVAPNPANLNLLLDSPPSREFDADTPPDPDPTTNLVGAIPDQDYFDDGLRAGILVSGTPGTVTFRVSSTTGITNWFVNVLFDWDYSGKWAGVDPLNGAPEWAVVNMPVTVGALKSQWFTSPPFLVGSTPQDPWMRITLSDTAIPVPGWPMGWDGSVPPGTFDFNGRPAFKCGETEDYCGKIRVDARDPFYQGPKIFCDRTHIG